MADLLDSEELIEDDDYYAWLGLSREATRDDVNNAFRRLSRIYHPDKHVSNADNAARAETLFTKIKKAYDVLVDPHRKAIYDTMGVKGLQTEGWEIVSRTKTPQEILEEYERLKEEREQRRLEQQTNPRGSLVMSIDATDIFQSYPTLSPSVQRTVFSGVEISQMSISQSVDCPLTVSDSATIAGSLSTENGTGSGNVSVLYRRLVTNQSWLEGEAQIGSNSALTMRGYHSLWARAHATMATTFHFSARGVRPVYQAVLAQQLSKHVLGRMTFQLSPRHSSMQTTVIYDNESNHVAVILQVGIPNSFVMLSYIHRFTELDLRITSNLKFGTMSQSLEYGCEKKVTQFSRVGASITIGIPVGVVLKLRLNRGNQSFLIPIQLAEDVMPEPIFYGTVIPVVSYFVIKSFIISPVMKNLEERKLKKKKEANQERLNAKKAEAASTVELMKETVDRSYDLEQNKGGLVIKKALYGKMQGSQINEHECINVTRPLQALIKDSRIILPEDTRLSELPGFYDPCVGEEKSLVVTYEFRRQLHVATFQKSKKIVIPQKDHKMETDDEHQR